MLSEYFKMKTESCEFKTELNNLINELKDKKIVIYGAGVAFVELFKKFQLKELNIVAIADKKFEAEGTFEGLKSIAPDMISKQDYDTILISLEYPEPIIAYIENDLGISDKEIKCIFNESFPQERDSYLYLKEIKFQKRLNQLNKKLKNKKIVLYGAGCFFKAINAHYDLSKLNIIAVADKKFVGHSKDEKFLNYNVCAPDEIVELKPDYVLVATKFFINIIEDLYYSTLKDTKIKIKPLIKKPFLTLLKEIWC